MIPGETLPADGFITLNGDVDSVRVDVENTGDRPIQVGSHFHFFEANRALRFDRAATYGHRLDIPSGTAVRFEPGERRPVSLIPLRGERVVRGLNGLVDGPLGTADAAIGEARRRGFLGA